MTAKAPEPPPESTPAGAASSTGSTAAQPGTTGEPATKPTPPAAPPTPAAPAPVAPAPAAPSAPAAGGATGAAKPATVPAKAGATRPPARPTTPRGGGAAVAFAILALLVAVGATAVAIYALDVAREAKSAAAGAAGGPASPEPVPTAQASPPAAAGPTATPTPRPTAQFVAERVRASLSLPPAQGCGAVYVDVDDLQVGALSGHEFYLSSCLGPQAVRIDRTSGATPTSANPTPEVCAAQLAGTSTASELVLQIRVGLTFCLITNLQDATSLGIPQRIAIVEVTQVGSDQAVTMAISTYRVPNQTP